MKPMQVTTDLYKMFFFSFFCPYRNIFNETLSWEHEIMEIGDPSPNTKMVQTL